MIPAHSPSHFSFSSPSLPYFPTFLGFSNIMHRIRKEKAKKRRENYDNRKFVSGEAENRFERIILPKNLIAERGFHNPGGQVEGIIYSKNWHYFTRTPSEAVVPVVREFYANLPEHRESSVFVRGKWVKFDKATINQLYQLQGYEEDEYTTYTVRPLDYDMILEFLCGGDASVTWKRKDNKVVNFPSAGLSSNSKAWHYFITGRLMPSGNTSEVTRERAILNYCIQRDVSIDVGKIIHQSILNHLSAHVSVALGHPSTIHDLCVSQGVVVLPSEEILQPKSAVTKQKIHSYSSRLFEPGESSAQATPPQRSKPLSITEQVGQLRGSVQDLCDTMKEHNKWHENLDDKVTHYMEQQIQHYDYVSDFNSSLSRMFTNCHLNIGPNRVEFPEPPIYSYFSTPPPEGGNEEEGDEEEE